MTSPWPDPRRLAAASLALAMTVSALVPERTRAQERELSPQEERWRDADLGDDLYFAASNAVVSGVAAAVIAAFRDHVSVREAFLGGAAGGLAVFLAKRVAAERFTGAGLLARQIGSVGASVGRNAAAGRMPFERIVLSAGLARIYWDRASGEVQVKPDLNAIGWTVRAAFEPRAEFDWSRSLSAGAPVFLTRDATFENGAAGRALGNVIVADPAARIPLDDIMAHERVHVVQLDQHFILWGEVFEGWAAGLLGDRSSGIVGHVDLVLPTILTGLGVGALWPGPWVRNPLETEAYFMQMR